MSSLLTAAPLLTSLLQGGTKSSGAGSTQTSTSPLTGIAAALQKPAEINPQSATQRFRDITDLVNVGGVTGPVINLAPRPVTEKEKTNLAFFALGGLALILILRR